MPTTAVRRKAYAAVHGFKAVDVANGTFEAIVAVFNNVDLGGDRIMSEAFDRTLGEWKASGDPIPIIFSHQWDNLYAHVGGVTEAKALQPGDAMLPPELKELGGLWVKGQLDLAAPGEAGSFAKHLWTKMRTRLIKEFSFAYDIPPMGARPAKDALDLIDLDLIEVGPTLKGMNPSTALLDTKSARDAVAKMTPMQALEYLDGLVVPPPPARKTQPGAVKAQVELARKMWATVEGSYEDVQAEIADAASDVFNPMDDPNVCVCVEATFPDHVLVSVSAMGEPESDYFQMDWSLADDVVMLGEPTQVDVEVVITPLSAAEQAEEASEGAASTTTTGTASSVARGAKRMPRAMRPAGAVEDTLDSIRGSASVWGQLKYGRDLFMVHLEATFLSENKALVTAERWDDPFGEGPMWELAYEMDAEGMCTIKSEAPVEVDVTLRRPSATAAKTRLKSLLTDGGGDLVEMISMAAALKERDGWVSTVEPPAPADEAEVDTSGPSPLEMLVDLAAMG